jgi:PAS domain S-box-containing protein
VGGGERAIVVDSHNRILGINPQLADEIGWVPDDLVGRRVVAIIPPSYREAHTAGFTRHLTTGEAHALGVAVELPVLRSDGSERPYTFFIEADRSPSGKAVYIARLTPLAGPPAAG